MFHKINNEKGFVLAEFVIALPLLILLIYTLVMIFLNVAKQTEKQSADYLLEEEANEILERIKNDARAATEVKLEHDGEEFQTVIFVFHAIANTNPNIYDVHDTRNYIIYSKNQIHADEDGQEPIYRVYAHRKKNPTFPTSPTSGDNSFGNTTVKKLKFTIREKNILHISLTLKSLKTKRMLTINTSVFMPDCKKFEGF